MTDEKDVAWLKDVRKRLERWGNWVRGNQLIRNRGNVLAAEIQRAAGEHPGTDLSVPYDLTFELEVIEKSIARFKLEANRQHLRRKQYMDKARDVLFEMYVGDNGTYEIAVDMNVSEEHVKALEWYAASTIGRYIPEVEKDLHLRKSRNNIGGV